MTDDFQNGQLPPEELNQDVSQQPDQASSDASHVRPQPEGAIGAPPQSSDDNGVVGQAPLGSDSPASPAEPSRLANQYADYPDAQASFNQAQQTPTDYPQQPGFQSFPPPQQPFGPGGPTSGGPRKENIILPIISFVISLLVLILSWVTPIPYVFTLIGFFGILFAVLALVLNWKRKKIFSIIALAVASFVFFISGAAALFNALRLDMGTEITAVEDIGDDDVVDDDVRGQNGDTDESSFDVNEYIADPDDYKFKWTVEEYMDLKFAGYDDKEGSELGPILEKFGKASTAEASQNGDYLNLIYYYPEDSKSLPTLKLVLRFKKQDNGKYLLLEGSSYGFTLEGIETISEDDYDSKWTQEELDSLTVSSEQENKDGTKLSDVLKKYGKPTRVTEFISNYGEGFRKSISIYYEGTNTGEFLNFVNLEFYNPDDGDEYYLTFKYPDADDQ